MSPLLRSVLQLGALAFVGVFVEVQVGKLWGCAAVAALFVLMPNHAIEKKE